MTPVVPTPDAHQREAIRHWVADLAAMPGVAEVLGWQVIDPDGFPDEGRRPEGIYVEFRFRRRDEDPGIWHRLQVGPIAPATGTATDGGRADEAIRLLRILRDREDDPGGKGYLIGAIEAIRDGDPVPEEWLEGLRRAVAKGDAS